MRRPSGQLKEELKQYKVHQENDKWIGFRICPECKKEIKHACSNLSRLKTVLLKNRNCVECVNGKSKLYDKDKHRAIEPKFNGELWYDFRICPNCKNEIKYTSHKPYILTRSIRNANMENYSCLSCAMTGEGNSFFGRTHSEKTKNQVSKSRTGKACGENNAMANPENRQKVSEGLKKGYDSGRFDYIKVIQSNNAINGHKNGRYNSKPISKQENKLKQLLEDLNYKIEPQFLIETLRYDFFLKEYNTLIEYNGDYWHCNPEKYDKNYFNQKKNKFAYELWENDKNKKELAIKNGYKFFTVWEKDFIKNNKEEINKIISKL